MNEEITDKIADIQEEFEYRDFNIIGLLFLSDGFRSLEKIYTKNIYIYIYWSSKFCYYLNIFVGVYFGENKYWI